MDTVRAFSDRTAVARYAEETPRRVPGYVDLHRMAMLLLAEGAPQNADILVYGAGGGLELKAFAEAQPGWRLLGVDPAAEMLALARETLGPLKQRVDLLQGFIDDVPKRDFDGATCLLTLHFLGCEERLAVLKNLHGRLKPGAVLVIAHHSQPAGFDLQTWLTRSVAFAGTPGAKPLSAPASARLLASRLPLLTQEEEEVLLTTAGFSHVALFYAAFSFRGWVARA